MRRKNILTFLFLCALALALSTSANGQTLTQVSGTITDPNGLPYSNATISIQLSGGGSTPQVTPCAVAPCPVTNPPPIQTDASGKFSIALWANGSITPGSTQWSFLVQEPGVAPPWGFGPKSFTLTTTISGSSQSLSSAMDALAPALTPAFSGGGTPCTTAAGAIQYNLSSAFGCNADFTYTQSTGLFLSTQAGTFNNTATNEYNLFTLTGGASCSPFTIPSGVTDALTACMNVPASASNFQDDALRSEVLNNSSSDFAVASYSSALCTASTCGGIWGANPNANDNGFATPWLIGQETDVNYGNVGSVGQGMRMTGVFNAIPPFDSNFANGGFMPALGFYKDARSVTNAGWSSGIYFSPDFLANPSDGAILLGPVSVNLPAFSHFVVYTAEPSSGVFVKAVQLESTGGTMDFQDSPIQVGYADTFAHVTAHTPCNSTNIWSIAGFTDSNTTTWGATIAGGGGNKVVGVCDGTNYTVLGI